MISMKHSIMTMNHMVHHRNPSRMFHRNELCMDHSFSPSRDSGPHENNLKLSMSKTRAPHYHPNSPIKSFCLRISILEKVFDNKDVRVFTTPLQPFVSIIL